MDNKKIPSRRSYQRSLTANQNKNIPDSSRHFSSRTSLFKKLSGFRLNFKAKGNKKAVSPLQTRASVSKSSANNLPKQPTSYRIKKSNFKVKPGSNRDNTNNALSNKPVTNRLTKSKFNVKGKLNIIILILIGLNIIVYLILRFVN